MIIINDNNDDNNDNNKNNNNNNNNNNNMHLRRSYDCCMICYTALAHSLRAAEIWPGQICYILGQIC